MAGGNGSICYSDFWGLSPKITFFCFDNLVNRLTCLGQ